MKDFFGGIGQSAAFIFTGLNRLYELFAAIIKAIVSSFYTPKVIQPRHVFNQMVLMGVNSIGIVCLVGASVGMVLALQAAYQLKSMGAEVYTGGLVSVTMCRELGPLVAAIVLTGRVGARMAAELGTMVVQEEVDALTTMGLNPVRYLVVPRVIALIIVLPCLTVICDLMGMLGGYIIGTYAVGINPYLYLANNFDSLVIKDIYEGLIKSGIFAFLIALICCHQGLSVSGGAEGVGKATTSAVVTSLIVIIVMDGLATAVLVYALPS